MAAPTGYIYCITNPTFKADHTYKLGYTGSEVPIDRVRKKLLQRYGTYFGTPECVGLLKVLTPALAERRLFQLLTEFNTQKEFFQADFETVIRPALEVVGREFGGEDEPITTASPTTEIVHEFIDNKRVFNCSSCDYNTSRKSSYDKHNLSSKHQQSKLANDKPYQCQFCKERFTHASSFSRHKKTCIKTKTPIEMPLPATLETTAEVPPSSQNVMLDQLLAANSLLLEVVRNNADMQNHLMDVLKQNQELQKAMLELCQKNMAKNNITIDVK